MTTKKRLLVVEDEEAILRGLTDLFVFHGYEVESARDGESGLGLASTGRFDLMILDVMLPVLDGFAVCNRIRETDRELPIIMLTAKSGDEDIIDGFTLGADDYVTKPFSVRALVLRVEAILRRSGSRDAERDTIVIGGAVTIDTGSMRGTAPDGASIEFSRREIDIIRYLRARPGVTVSRGELLEEVWGYAKGKDLETRTVDIHIAKLRRKIELDPKKPRFLVTVRNEGYQLLTTGT